MSLEEKMLSSRATLFLIFTVPVARFRFIVFNSLMPRKLARFSVVLLFVILPSLIMKLPFATRFFFIFSGNVPAPCSLKSDEMIP